MAVQINKEKLAWAAGLFEGEGSFSINSGNGRTIQAAVSMTDLDVVENFQAVVGMGKIYPYTPRQVGWKPQYRWAVNTYEEVQMLAALLWPWLKTRRRTKIKEVLAYGCQPTKWLSPADRMEIRRQHSMGVSKKVIAGCFNRSLVTINRAIRREVPFLGATSA